MSKKSIGMICALALWTGLVFASGFYFASYKVGRGVYLQLKEKGLSDQEIAGAVRNADSIVYVQHQDEDLDTLKLALIDKLLLLHKDDDARAKLRDLIRDYYQKAKPDPSPSETRIKNLKKIESLTEWDKDLLKDLMPPATVK